MAAGTVADQVKVCCARRTFSRNAPGRARSPCSRAGHCWRPLGGGMATTLAATGAYAPSAEPRSTPAGPKLATAARRVGSGHIANVGSPPDPSRSSVKGLTRMVAVCESRTRPRTGRRTRPGGNASNRHPSHGTSSPSTARFAQGGDLRESTGCSARNEEHEAGPARQRPLSMAWIPDDLLAETIELWSESYGRPISEDEAVEILMNVKRMGELLVRMRREAN